MSCRPSFKSDMFETWSSSPLQSLPIFCDHRECQCTLRHLTDECTTKLVRHFLAHPSRPLASGRVDPTPNINSQVFQENNKKGPSKGEGSTSPLPLPGVRLGKMLAGFSYSRPQKQGVVINPTRKRLNTLSITWFCAKSVENALPKRPP